MCYQVHRHFTLHFDSPSKLHQGSKKVLSDCPGQANFPAGQLTFHSRLFNGHRPQQVVFKLNNNNKKTVN